MLCSVYCLARCLASFRSCVSAKTCIGICCWATLLHDRPVVWRNNWTIRLTRWISVFDLQSLPRAQNYEFKLNRKPAAETDYLLEGGAVVMEGCQGEYRCFWGLLNKFSWLLNLKTSGCCTIYSQDRLSLTVGFYFAPRIESNVPMCGSLKRPVWHRL